jgi:hypothetical protein
MSLRDWIDAARDSASYHGERIANVARDGCAIVGVVGQGIWHALSPMARLAVIAAAAGVPTSIYGMTWMLAKPTKMLADCRNDLYYDAAQLGAREFRENPGAVFERHASCIGSVSFNVGDIEFLRQQNRRWQDGRP